MTAATKKHHMPTKVKLTLQFVITTRILSKWSVHYKKFCCHLFNLTVFAGRIVVKRLLQLSNWQIICQNHATKVFFFTKVTRYLLRKQNCCRDNSTHMCVYCSFNNYDTFSIKIDNITVMMKKPLKRLNEIKKYFQVQEQSKLQSITNCWQSK